MLLASGSKSVAIASLARVALLVLLLALLTCCQDASAPAQPAPTTTPLAFIWMSDLLQSPPANNQPITTVGYMLVDRSGGTLVDAIVYDSAGRPQPLDPSAPALWLGADARSLFRGTLRSAGDLQYATVAARARLAGPGSFGPRGQYHYQLTELTLEPLGAQETTIAALLEQPAVYEGRLVRLVGGLLIRETSALLVDNLGTGGIPAPKARQLKLRRPIANQAILSRLKSAPGGAVHFGQVQIEGFWRDGVLTPLSISVAT